MATGSTFGQLNEFRPGRERLSVYLERFELYISANSVPEEKKVPLFLTVIGGTVYSLLHDLFAPESPVDKPYTTIIEKLKAHFEPKPVNILTHRYTFHQRNQGPDESIAEYVAELRRLASHCEFGTFLEQALRDRLVFGMRSESTKKRVLTEKEPTLKGAMEVALSLEAAQKNVQTLRGSEVPQLHKLDRRRPTEKKNPKEGEKPCYRCGRAGHAPNACVFRQAKCFNCGKSGHVASVCRSKKKQTEGHSSKRSPPGRTQWVDTEITEPQASVNEPAEELIWQLGAKTSRPYQAILEVNGQSLTMEIDTGAAVSLISQTTQEELFPSARLDKSSLVLRTYTDETIPVQGQMEVEVRYGGYTGHHKLYVVRGKGPPLLGRNWLQHIRLDWASVRLMSAKSSSQAVEEMTRKYPEVFQEGLGTMKHVHAHLSLREGANPRFCRPRPIPFAIKETVSRELDRLEATGILRKVDHSDWAAPIVPVPKKDGTIRVCGDFKVTINPMLQVDQYPLPNPNELMASLAGGKHFTKLDLTAAYQQMLLDDESTKLVTLNTHKGLYECTRLPFGVASAPAVFQRAMDTILQGIPYVVCYIDDILVTGTSEADHLEHLEEVLRRLQENGLRLQLNKCQFFQASVEFLGYVINAEGVHTSSKKVKAITEARAPQNVSELRAFLGLVNYYGKFVPNLASLLHPLYSLLHSGVQWKWSKECQQAFEEAKEKLVSAPVLTHYDINLPIRMAGDASQYGVGAVISHTMPDGSERPIAFASRTLSSSEKRYAQVEKEALSLVFGIKKFHQFLYGRHFTLVTDHKPLTAILGPKNGVPSLAAARMQRWALLLSGYSYDIQFRPTKAHGNADGLSRLPLQDDSTLGNYEDTTVFNIAQVDALPVHASQVMTATRTDPLLSKVMRYARTGWPAKVPDELRPLWRKREEIAVEDDCVLWGTRVIVPVKLRQQVLGELHRGHPGVVRMKALARSHVWWPGLDRDVEECAKSCEACQSNKHSPPKAPLHPWAWPTVPWQRIHVDFAGPVRGQMLLVITDAHSKWPEVYTMSSTTANKTITKLRETFARYGLPEQLISDNGPQFVSEELETFLRVNGVKHIRSSPYHPASNGAAERLVQTVKQALEAGRVDGVPLEQTLATFLLCYRATPHATTGVPPSTLLMGRTLRTRLDLIKPDVGRRVREQQAHQKTQHDTHTCERQFVLGQRVWVRNMREGPRWVDGVITGIQGPVSYLVRVASGAVWRRHVDHIRDGKVRPPATSVGDPKADSSDLEDSLLLPERLSSSSTNDTSPAIELSEPSGFLGRRYPSRVHRPPVRYGQ